MYNLAYKLDTKEFLGCRFDPEPQKGEGMIQVDNKSDIGVAIKNGHTITINEDLSITATEPIASVTVPTAEDNFKATIKSKGVDNINAADVLEYVKIEMKNKKGYE